MAGIIVGILAGFAIPLFGIGVIYNNVSISLSAIAVLVLLWFLRIRNKNGFDGIDQSEKDELFVVIVGAGFSGICAAVQLRLRGIPFIVFEGASSIGGTWWYNKYPGCACDIPGLVYSYSFYKYKGPRFVPLQSETLSYLKEVCQHYGVTEFIKLNTKVSECSFDEEKKRWLVKTSNGDCLVCTHLLSAIGGLTVPRYPHIQGLDDFRGDQLHTACWPTGYDLRGKRVGVIGTGASATQLISNITGQVKELTVFQRAPAWVVSPAVKLTAPKFLSEYNVVRELVEGANRLLLFVLGDIVLNVAMTKGRLSNWLKVIFEKDMLRQVKKVEVQKKIIPSTEIATKRLIINDQYLQCFNKEHVQLVDQGIEKITQTGVMTTDRLTYDMDTIIHATGFDTLNSMKGLRVERNDGVTLSELWDDCPNAYNGVMFPGFPNLFILLGPNTILAHSSVVFMIECQVNFFIDAMLKTIQKNKTLIEVTEQANEEYKKKLQSTMRLRNFSGNNGCTTWYVNPKGINFTLWPSSVLYYWYTLANFKTRHFIFR